MGEKGEVLNLPSRQTQLCVFCVDTPEYCKPTRTRICCDLIHHFELSDVKSKHPAKKERKKERQRKESRSTQHKLTD